MVFGPQSRLVLAFFVIQPCKSFHVKAGPNHQFGQKMANFIKDADRNIAADSKSENGGVFQKSFADTLNADEEVLVNPNVSEVIAQANSLAEHELLAPDSLCPRNWAQLCPDGWSRIGDLVCSAPASYEGPCRKLQTFANSSTFQKYKFSASCNAPWPCEDECKEGHEYESCPKGWKDAGDNFCEAPVGISSKCMNSYRSKEMSIAQKQELAIICGFEWKCQNKCDHDYSKTCPEKWIELPDLCMAPATYAGDCGYGINTTGMTENQKRKLAEKCSVEFPCIGSNSVDQQYPSKISSWDGIPNGPIDSKTGHVVQHPYSPQKREFATRFEGRFVVPSGPIDSIGDIHF